MIEAIDINAVTQAPEGNLDDDELSVHENALGSLWSVQSNKSNSLEDFVQATFSTELDQGVILQKDDYRLIQLSPYRALIISEAIALPQAIANYESMLTDVSHGYCELCVTGKQAIEFLRLYISADMAKAIDSGSFSLSCLLGQYSCILWWHDINEIHILVERSYAQSFRNYLNHLIQRYHW
jgi:heterotetrameric sarcosine oxidase gamma subunit|tara:strand:- start:17480 stop:18025 length:546 start_codon:yes stop_codon:yes gene_type:complete